MTHGEIQELVNRYLSSGYKVGEFFDKGGQSEIYRISGWGEKAVLKIIDVDSVLEKSDIPLEDYADFKNKLINRCQSEIKSLRDLANSGYATKLYWSKEIPNYKGHYIALIVLKEYRCVYKSYIEQSKKMTSKEVVNCGIQICRALLELEKISMNHRDIKPKNIFYEEFRGERVYLLGDFGIAKENNSKSPLGNTTPVWTPGYKPDWGDVSLPNRKQREDMYALAISMKNLLLANNDTAPDMSKLGISSALRDILTKAVEHRYDSAQQMLEDLLEIESPKIVVGKFDEIIIEQKQQTNDDSTPHRIRLNERLGEMQNENKKTSVTSKPLFKNLFTEFIESNFFESIVESKAVALPIIVLCLNLVVMYVKFGNYWEKCDLGVYDIWFLIFAVSFGIAVGLVTEKVISDDDVEIWGRVPLRFLIGVLSSVIFGMIIFLFGMWIQSSATAYSRELLLAIITVDIIVIMDTIMVTAPVLYRITTVLNSLFYPIGDYAIVGLAASSLLICLLAFIVIPVVGLLGITSWLGLWFIICIGVIVGSSLFAEANARVYFIVFLLFVLIIAVCVGFKLMIIIKWISLFFLWYIIGGVLFLLT